MKFEFLNGVKTHAPDSREQLINYAVAHNKIMIAVNAEKIMHATEESRAIANRNLGYPDGIGAVWSLHKKGHKSTVKISGCELWLDILVKYYSSKSFYLVGGKQQVIEATIKKLQSEFKGINISNYRNGYLANQDEEEELIADIVNKKPDVVFVAMGSPKQELLMERIQKQHTAVYQGLGGSFDVYIGKVKRAPRWWINNNLEWAYRLVRQPSRIKRQIHLLRFFVNLHLNKY
jgi:UDP-N-acetyl-D-mannosaminouronate:lipid I N-acetyl-D-mannosaminouronosyltransferase